MALPTHILLSYGYLLLFAWIVVEQLGVPLPAAPVLVAAGALSVSSRFSFLLALVVGLGACLIADSIWFEVGKRYGHHVLRILCKMSLEPTICVQRTQRSFGRRGQVTLVIAKFVPGLATLAPPVAGQNGMSYLEFFVLDGMGSCLWIGTLLAAGRFFGDALRRDPSLLAWFARFSGLLLVLAIAGVFAARVYRRKLVLRRLAASRLEPEELMQQMQAGEPVYIVDLRHPLELVTDPFLLPGAQRISPDDLAGRIHEIPRDRDVILYCTCPNEATAAKTAMRLHDLGIERVRPLRGGYDEWKRLGYPMDAIPPYMRAEPDVPLSAVGK